VKLAAASKEFVVAGVYGRSDAYEAFLTAALVPALLVNLVSEAMSQALIPTFVRVRDREGREQAQLLLSNVLFSTTVLLGVGVLGIATLARRVIPLLGSHFSTAKIECTVHLVYGLVPLVFLAGLASICTVVLNATGRFGLPALAAIAGPLTIIAVVPFTRAFGIWPMVFATIVGASIQLFWVAVMMDRNGYRLAPRWHAPDEDTVSVARQYGPIFLSGLVASGGLLVDQAIVAMLPSGNVAALAYGCRFVGVVLALAGGSIASALTPVFAEMTACRDWEGCRKTLRTWGWISGGVTTLLAGALILSAHPLVRLAFQHGAFQQQDSIAVSQVLEMSAIQIPFFVLSRVFYRFLIAMRRSDLIFYCGLINLGLNIVLDLLLVRWMGVAGIALATSFWTASTLAFLSYCSWKVLSRSEQAVFPERVG
jgi:putative peptidoglycan lipid II flippase